MIKNSSGKILVDDVPMSGKVLVDDDNPTSGKILVDDVSVSGKVIVPEEEPSSGKIIVEKERQPIEELVEAKFANYCGICGFHFENKTDRFCPTCGGKREEMN